MILFNWKFSETQHKLIQHKWSTIVSQHSATLVQQNPKHSQVYVSIMSLHGFSSLSVRRYGHNILWKYSFVVHVNCSQDISQFNQSSYGHFFTMQYWDTDGLWVLDIMFDLLSNCTVKLYHLLRFSIRVVTIIRLCDVHIVKIIWKMV
jgi:hypothetical protein